MELPKRQAYLVRNTVQRAVSRWNGHCTLELGSGSDHKPDEAEMGILQMSLWP